jgi:hypothetical protein
MPILRMKNSHERNDVFKKSRPADKIDTTKAVPAHPADFPFTTRDVSLLSPASVLQLQRTVGNRAAEQLLGTRPVEQTAEAAQPSIQRSSEQEDELLGLACPGSKIRSSGQGRGEGTGEGQGPVGYPKDEDL